MAVHALKPAASPANTDRARFNLALAHCAIAGDARDALPSSSTIHDEIAAGEALERAQVVLAMAIAPDHATLAKKLRLTLSWAGVHPAVIDSLVADVSALDRRAKA
ncbi:hypothetical protein ASE69_17070 [Sphingomonas sp. Leaf208]|uniref:hypothetical protein n=1 Tax=Sphingomonas sp. Leaf208 TaxID=1735679 RepID=UPI0006F4D7A4|nr:hypothetical protein [Sphingomonas sp. Leaf208]KQM46014.1 hypothetical protein ASE69_17070 [Sphingomonas sp. Leaf208]